MDFLLNGDETGRTTILLAHGSGAAMDTPWMDAVAEGLEAHGFRAARFEFSYMSARRTGGSKRPPQRPTPTRQNSLPPLTRLAAMVR